MATQKNDMSSNLSSLEATLEEYLVDKAPFQLPKNIKELIVSFAPWLIIIFLVLSLPAVFSIIGFSSMMGPYMMGGMMRYGYHFGPLWWVSMALIVVSVVFEALAIKGLFAKTMQGWKYVFYAQLISIVAMLFQGNLPGAVLGGLIGLYILFQVKEMYT